MDRDKWTEVVTGFGWLCFRCQQGHLRYQAGLAHFRETADSHAIGIDQPHLPPEHYEERIFACIIVCDHCNDPVAVSGIFSWERLQVGWEDYEETNYYRVKAVNPAPAPFIVPASVPQSVSQHIRAAAGILWTDHDAAANKIRQCVEAMLDERGVKKYPRTGPRRAIALDHRIKAYGQQNHEVAHHLMAIKWIGNAGSHGDGIGRNDVLDALEIIEQVFEDVYVGHRAKLRAKVAKIIARKKPLPKPKMKFGS
jgi:hypothetical protein